MSMTTSPEVAAYAAMVRDELSDVGGAEARGLLDGLDEHLAEVAADGEVSLVEVLGPPAAYAAELRASAGLPVRDRTAAIAAAAAAAPTVVTVPEFPGPDSGADPVVGSTPPLPPPTAVAHAQTASAEPSAAADRPAPVHVAASELAARLWLGVVAIIVFVVVVRASQPIDAPRILGGAAITGLLASTFVFGIRRSGLSEVARRRLGVAMAGVAALGAVWLGGQFSEGETEYVPFFDSGAVTTITMSPFAGQTTVALPGEVITTSAAPAPGALVTVPDVVGLSADEAVNVLAPLGVQVVFVAPEGEIASGNIVLAQSVEAGGVVPVGEVVTLTISGASSSVDTTIVFAEPTLVTSFPMGPSAGDNSTDGPTGATTTTVSAATTTATP